MNNSIKYAKISIWALLGLSIFSCLARNDFNILASFFLLGLLSLYYKQYQQTTLKIAIQLLSCVIGFDVIWVIIFSFVWSHDEDQSEYWNSLAWMHGMVYFLAFFEMIAKGVALFFFIKEYKVKSSLSELIKANYFDESMRTDHKGANNAV